MFSLLLKAIDAHWMVAYKPLQVSWGYLNPKVDILPKYIYLFPRTQYCPIKKRDYTKCCSWLKRSQDGTMITSCFSSDHNSGLNYKLYSKRLSSLFTNSRAYILNKRPKQAYDLPFDEQQQQTVLTSTNPFVHWLNDTNRRDVDRIKCDPNSKGCAGDINT